MRFNRFNPAFHTAFSTTMTALAWIQNAKEQNPSTQWADITVSVEPTPSDSAVGGRVYITLECGTRPALEWARETLGSSGVDVTLGGLHDDRCAFRMSAGAHDCNCASAAGR